MTKRRDRNLRPGELVELDPARVKPFADQPRKRFRGIAKLTESIRLIGQVTPITVTACEDPQYDAELVDGERRLRACRAGGFPVKAIVESRNGEVADRYVRSVAANFCRQEHDAVEIMEAVIALRAGGKSYHEIAGMLGKTACWAMQYASLAKLHPVVLEELKIAGEEAKADRHARRRPGRLTRSVALLLVPLDQRLQVKALRLIQAGKMSMEEARTAVFRMGRNRGCGAKPVRKRRAFQSLKSGVANCFHVVNRYLNLPGLEIRALLATASPAERKALAGRLEKLCEALLMLADALEEGPSNRSKRD